MPQWLFRLWYDLNYSWMMAVFTFGWSLRFEGAGHIPRRGPVLLLANHQSFLDPPLVGVAISTRRMWALARKNLFRNRLFGGYLASVGGVPVDQDGVAKEGLQIVLDLLARDQAVLIFPEGERTWNGSMQPLKPGITLLLKRSNAPVVPVGIAGAFEALPRTSAWPHLAPLLLPAGLAGVAVSVGPVIDRSRYQGKGREEVLGVLFEAIAAQQRRAERLRRKPRR
jgi:1-acyl-sn-glycerol-3-phosphate acyltransferase